MDRINTLHEKLDVLLRQYKALKGECSSIQSALVAKEEEAAILRTQLAKCEEQLLAVKIGNAIPNAEGRADSRRQLDAVIAEIDKILGTLND